MPLSSRSLFLFALATTAAAGLAARAQDDPEPAFDRPEFNDRRFEEDWSGIKGFDPEDRFDPFKHVALGENAYASFGGQLRARGEYFNNHDFGGSDPDSGWALLNRVRAHADLHVAQYFRVFVEGRGAFRTEDDFPRDRTARDIDSIDLQNAFLEIGTTVGDDARVYIRPGRQELDFGRGRLVSAAEWSNAGQSFDGVRAGVRSGEFSVDAWWANPVENKKYEFNDGDSDIDFFGVYGSWYWASRRLEFDLYWLAKSDDNASLGGLSGDEDRYTFGGRVGRRPGGGRPLDWDLELAGQRGDLAGSDIEAVLFAAEAGWTFGESETAPRLFAGFELATGDDGAGDGFARTFDQLFADPHEGNGIIDAVGRQNLLSATVGLQLPITEDFRAEVAGYWFWRKENSDALYAGDGSVLRASGGSLAREVGQEIDITVEYSLGRHSTLEGGYGHFFPDEFINNTSQSEDIDFLYASFKYTF